MSNSDRRINYSVRPAKNIERKIIKDVLIRLHPFDGASTYRYVGFGAKYFSDFSLFHRQLHIQDLVSIESDTSSREKYEFNKPFSCIEMKFGSSESILPTLTYEKKSIFWLDYDGQFNSSVLRDLATVLEVSVSGSFMIFSFNSKPFNQRELKKKYDSDSIKGLYKRKLIELVGEEMIPTGMEERGLSKWGNYSNLIHKIFLNQVNKTLQNRNISSSLEERWSFKQVLYIDYIDGVEMTTIGGMLLQEKDKNKFENCNFNAIDHCRMNNESLLISLPCLTMKEINTLMEKMPLSAETRKNIDKKVFLDRDIENFAKFYKYFPNFSEVENV